MEPIELLNILEHHGYTSYLVGGYVRDYLLGIKSFDIDITTIAKPIELLDIFNIDTHINYGCISFRIEPYNIEITTFRRETYDKDRHPKIEYISSILEDLDRRDFTINAILMDSECKIIDPLKGIDDLNNKVIRVIGDTSKKFNEDPLRILRAIRFASTYGFTIEQSAKDFIINNSSILNNLSKESIKRELDIMFTKNPVASVNLLDNLGVLKTLGLKVKYPVKDTSLEGVWATLEGFDAYIFTKKERKHITSIASILSTNKIDANSFLTYEYDDILSAGLLMGLSKRDIQSIYDAMPIKSIDDLQINGEDIIKLIKKDGAIVDYIKSCLIKEILSGNLSNEKTILEKYIIEKWKCD